MTNPFKQARPLLEKIIAAGHEAYFVGGCVRDFLLKKEIHDVDIATSATPMEIKELFPRTVDIGIEHGTVLVLYNGQPYEITTFRAESDYEAFRRPKEVQFIRNLFEDLERRDFTMNAIAMSVDGAIIDPFHGQESIHNKLIQTVGNPDNRFQEDALRMMRAIRFVSQLNFTISNETLEAIKRNKHLLSKISIERKMMEFEKLLCGSNRKKAIKLLMDSRAYSYIPNLEVDSLITFQKYDNQKLDLLEMWALLLFTLGLSEKKAKSFLNDWKLSNNKINSVISRLRFLNIRFNREWSELLLYKAGEEISVSTEKIFQVIKGINENITLKHIKDNYQALPIKNRKEMVVTGEDIMRWVNKDGGPWLREIIESIEEEIVQGNVVNEKEAIREWLTNCNLN
ncbi:CCA tRNA nucleotidyltransferase [Pseudoneobacillus sp. C159]